MIKEKAGLVKKLSQMIPGCRDNDNRLIANFWMQELRTKGLTVKELTAGEFLSMFASGELSSPETIRRSRQKLQEEFIFLRGKLFYKRKGKNEAEVRNEIRDWS